MILSRLGLHHTPETTLVMLQDNLLWEDDIGAQALLVVLDLSAAFDTINHGILLGRPSKVEIGSLALSWPQSFL